MPRGRMHSSGDIRQFAQDCKTKLITQFTNQMNSSNLMFDNYFNNQNVDPNIIEGNKYNDYKPYSKYQSNSFSPIHSLKYHINNNQLNNQFIEKIDYENENNFYLNLNSCPKRNQSSEHLEVSNNSNNRKTSLFATNDIIKGEEYESLNEIFNNINCELWEYALTQKGSRDLQKVLNNADNNDIDRIIFEIKDYFKEIMTNVYGNYFSQKLIQSCSSQQRINILKHVKKKFLIFRFYFHLFLLLLILLEHIHYKP